MDRKRLVAFLWAIKQFNEIVSAHAKQYEEVFQLWRYYTMNILDLYDEMEPLKAIYFDPKSKDWSDWATIAEVYQSLFAVKETMGDIGAPRAPSSDFRAASRPASSVGGDFVPSSPPERLACGRCSGRCGPIRSSWRLGS